MNLHVEHNWYNFYSGLQLHNRSATVQRFTFERIRLSVSIRPLRDQASLSRTS